MCAPWSNWKSDVGHIMKSQRLILGVAGLLALQGPSASVATGQAPDDAGSLEALLDTRVSAASLYAQTAADAPASVTIVTAEDISRFGWQTLEEVLSWVRGFHTTNDRNYSYVGVRGFSLPTDYNNRVLLLLDGNPVNDAFYGMMPAGFDLGIDLRTLEVIEIVRGPGSALYGSNAMFAVVNLVSKPHEAGGWVSASGGSQRARRASAGAALSINGFDVGISGSYGRTEGEDLYFPELGLARDMDGEEYHSFAGNLSRGAWTVSARMSGRHKQVPTASWGSALNDDRTRTYDEWGGVSLRFAPTLDASSGLELKLNVDHYFYDGRYASESGLSADENDVNRWTVAGHYRRDLRPDNRLVVGADFRRVWQASYHLWDADTVWFDEDFPYSSWSAFIQDEHDVTAELSLLVGVRHDASGLGFARTSPRAALVWAPLRSTTLKALYGEAFRAPSVYERYYEDEAFRAGPLEPELARTAEIIWEQRIAPSVQTTVSAFATRMTDLIETTEDSSGIASYQNAQSAVSRGIEAELQARRDGLAGRAVYTYTHVRVEGERATNSPAHLLRLGFAAPLSPRYDLALETRWESGRLTVRDSRTHDALYADANLSVRDVLPGVTARLSIRNLLDADNAAPAGFEHVQAAIPQPGRRLELQLDYEF